MSDDHEPEVSALFSQHADRLFGLAYRMLGEVGEAEDAVQDAFVRWSAADRSDIREPGAWLTTVTTRICLDRLTSARKRRETYVGSWLPEPLPTGDLDPADLAEMGDSLTLAFLVMLESLSPLERVVLVLHDVFGHPHDEVATMLGREPAAIRQAASRARKHVNAGSTRFEADRERQHDVTEAFLRACAGDHLEPLVSLLAPDVTFVGDGGGRATAIGAPLVGAERVARTLQAFWRTGQRLDDTQVDIVEVNAAPAIWIRESGTTTAVLVLEINDGVVTGIGGIRNPDKLAGFERRVTG